MQHELDNYESLHPGYDEYRYDLDDIGHDPYVLTSILSALHGGAYTLDEVQGDLDRLFGLQYTLTQTIETETRYRTETRTGTRTVTDPETGETTTEEYEYEVEVPYTYYICNVKLVNNDLSHLPVSIMSEEQLSLYAAYMQTLGNRPDLFPSGSYPNASTVKEPTYYEIPPEALEDETFAAMIAEADKYVGYPYVWGGSSPSTSFDCSGFISWVINHSGWNVGRLTAQGLYNICILEDCREPDTYIFYNGERIPAVTGEPIAAALIAAGVRTLRYTAKNHTGRSIFCGIGRCNDCKMVVNGVPNTRTCVTPVETGMRVETQYGLGEKEERQ